MTLQAKLPLFTTGGWGWGGSPIGHLLRNCFVCTYWLCEVRIISSLMSYCCLQMNAWSFSVYSNVEEPFVTTGLAAPISCSHISAFLKRSYSVSLVCDSLSLTLLLKVQLLAQKQHTLSRPKLCLLAGRWHSVVWQQERNCINSLNISSFFYLFVCLFNLFTHLLTCLHCANISWQKDQ